MNVNQSDYSFESLRYNGGKIDPEERAGLGYLVSLVDSPSHKISDPLPAKRILHWLDEVERQALNADHLKFNEEFFNRYFEGGFYPQTPCMIVNPWSPIGAMLERGMTPLILNREPKFRAVATGIWEPQLELEANEIEAAETDESLFWAIIGKVSQLALERKMWVNVITQPGWYYPSAINSLPDWPPEEVAKAGRVLWKKTWEG